MSNRVIRVQDRYELTFAIFVRDNKPTQGRIHHKPTLSSKRRLARVITRLHQEGKVQVIGFDDNPHVFNYVIVGDAS